MEDLLRVQTFSFISSRIIWSLERALINLVRQDDFTSLRVFEENVTLIAERVCIDLHYHSQLYTVTQKLASWT